MKTVKCPICRKESAWQGNPDRPFCSERCRMIDLGAWVSEEYAVAGETLSDPLIPDAESANRGTHV